MSSRRDVEKTIYERRYVDLPLETYDIEEWKDAIWEIVTKQVTPIKGKIVLDYGCGAGFFAMKAAQEQAKVIGLDISEQGVKVARDRALAARRTGRIDFVAAAGEGLPLEDEAIDCVIGIGILHHVDMERSPTEIARVLQKGGKAVFYEPLGENPILNWIRDRMPYPGNRRTPTERPLTYDDIELIKGNFQNYVVMERELLSMVRRYFKFTRFATSRVFDWLGRLDELLLNLFPFLRRWCRIVVIVLQR